MIPLVKHIQPATVYGSHVLQSYDPTRTTQLRNLFANEMSKRFRALRGIIRRAIVDQDCFSLSQHPTVIIRYAETTLSTPGWKAFNYSTSSEKVTAFMKWVEEQEKKGILETSTRNQLGSSINSAWTDKYITSAYQKGIVRGRQELVNAGMPVPGIEETGGLDLAFNQPLHRDWTGALYSRTYQNLKSITADMDKQISTVLSQGLIDGRNPKDLARMLNKTISGPTGDLSITDSLGRFIPAERRAKILARTEVIRAHHVATIQEYRNYGAVGVKVQAEWDTVGDGRTCEICSALEGQIFTLDEIEGKIPRHPQCRCMALPSQELVETKPTPRTQVKKPKAILPSVIKPTVVIPPKEPKKSLMGAALPMAGCVRSSTQKLALYAPLSTCNDFYKIGDKWVYGNRELNEAELERIKKMAIPPSWTNVVVAADPSFKVQAMGQDAAGRWQYRYSEEHIEAAAREKFLRQKSFARDIDGIRQAVDEDLKKGDSRAYLMRLEDQTAIRVGSDKDVFAKKKAYGLTTLQNEHIIINGDEITLEFTAKEGINQKYVLTDPVLAPWLAERKAATKVGEQLFPDVSASKLNAYIQDVAGGKDYTIKDFRTYHGTRIAQTELQQYLGKELTKREKQKAIKDICTKVSSFLHNTPTMARESYIDPMVWEMIGGLT